MHDDTRTTARTNAAARWAEIEPDLADDLDMLVAWSSDDATPDGQLVVAALDGVVTRIATSFENAIGPWRSQNGS